MSEVLVSDGWLSTREAAARLGVKSETLYAYVSRGVLRSERTPGGRGSRYLRADVERLAARQRGGGRAAGLEIVVESALTRIDPNGHLSYRGWDVADAAATATFEEVASWLWTASREPVPFVAPPPLVRLAARAVRAVPGVPDVDRLRIAIAAMRSGAPLRGDRRAAAVAETGRAIVAALVEALPLHGAAPEASGSIAARLWPRLRTAPRPRKVRVGAVALLDATMVLLADHELAASTLAARVAASTWADPFLVVQAGLAALGGPLHGGAAEAARDLLRQMVEGGASAPEAIGRLLEAGERVPGFGHRVYLDTDPRATILLDLLEGDSGPALAAGRALIETMRARGLPPPNVDLAVAMVTEHLAMVPGAGEILFALARIVGWLAHATEEYEHRLRFRPRAVYVGPGPG